MPRKKIESNKSKILDGLTDTQKQLKELQEEVLSWTYALDEYMQTEPGGERGYDLNEKDLLELSSAINVKHYIKLCDILNKQGIKRSTKRMENEKAANYNVFADKLLYESKRIAKVKMEQQLTLNLDKDEIDRDKNAE